MKIKKESRDLALFMIIGDGSLNANGYISIRHSKSQKEYLVWKQNLLRRNGIPTTDLYYVDNNGYGAYELRTYNHKFLKIYRKVIYKPSKIIGNRRLLDRLTPLGLAIWYMDDGGLSQKKRNGVIHANDLILNTHLSKEENQVIIDYFKEVWGISFTQVKNRGHYRLRCGTKMARKFIKIVEPFVSEVKCMEHKLNIKS